MAVVDFRFRPPTPHFDGAGAAMAAELPWIHAAAPLWRSELEPAPAPGTGPTFDDCLAWMRDRDVIGVLPGRLLTHSRLDNDHLLGLQHAHPGRFLAFPAVDGTDVDRAVDDVERFGAAGAPGMQVECGLHRPALFADDPSLYPFYAACEERRLIAMIHCGPFGGPDIAHSDPAPVCNVARAFPDLRIVMAHAGFPFVQEAVLSVLKRPNIWLAPDVYFDLPGGELYLDWANRSDLIASRLLWGSAMGWPAASGALERFATRGLRDGVMEQILWTNPAELLELDSDR
jgi:predicted TIM-barrel fold metal-dependent hydrolase